MLSTCHPWNWSPTLTLITLPEESLIRAVALNSVPNIPIRFVLLSSNMLLIVALLSTEARRGKVGRLVAFAEILTELGSNQTSSTTFDGRVIGISLNVIAPDDSVGSASSFILEII